MYRPPTRRKCLALHARPQDFESNGELLLATQKASLARQLSEKVAIPFRVLYLLEHISWRLPYSGRATSESEELVVPASSGIFGRSFPIVAAVIWPDNSHCHGHVSNNLVSFPLLFQSFHILTLRVRIFFSHSWNFSVVKFTCHCTDRRPVRCSRERSSGTKIVCIWKLPICAVAMDVHQKINSENVLNFYRNWPFHIAQKIPLPSNHQIISDLTVYLNELNLLTPCDTEPHQVLQR